MKRSKLFSLLFRRELETFEKRIDKLDKVIYDKDKEINKLKKDEEKSRKQYELIERIFSIDPNVKIVGIEKNKNNETLYVTEWITEDMLWIKLYGLSYRGITHLPRIMSKIHKNEAFKWNYINIQDILMTDDNIGNGSIAMKYFLRAAERMKVDHIDGGLSSVDKNHFERSEHYYKKFGFEVTFNEDRTSGSIKKIMK